MLDSVFFVIIKLELRLPPPIDRGSDIEGRASLVLSLYNILVVIPCTFLPQNIADSLRRRIDISLVYKGNIALEVLNCLPNVIMPIFLSCLEICFRDLFFHKSHFISSSVFGMLP